MSPIGTFRKCHLRRVKAALGSTADTSKPPGGAFMSSPPQSLNANPLRIPAPSTLLLSILRRMRQLALMLENLAQIAAIDPATAGRASHEAIRLCHLDRLANLRFDRPADIFPARDCRSIGCH